MYDWGNVKKDVESEERKVGVCTGSLLAMERDEEA